jgi:hypothetical protein
MIPFISVQSLQKASDIDVPVHLSGKDAHKRQALEPDCHQPWLLLRIKQRSSYYHLWKIPKVSLSFFLHGWIDMFRIAHNGCGGEPNDYHYPTVRISFTLINTSFSFPALQCRDLRVCFHDLSHLPIICTILIRNIFKIHQISIVLVGRKKYTNIYLKFFHICNSQIWLNQLTLQLPQ